MDEEGATAGEDSWWRSGRGTEIDGGVTGGNGPGEEPWRRLYRAMLLGTLMIRIHVTSNVVVEGFSFFIYFFLFSML